MILKSNKSKFISVVLAGMLLATGLNAQTDNCITKKFSMKISEEVVLRDVLNQFADMCEFSIVSKDDFSDKELSKTISGINIKNMSLTEVLNIFLNEKNLGYEFSNNVLKVSSLQTKVFKIDYITSVRAGKAVTKASVDAAPTEVGGGSGSSSDDSTTKATDNQIETTEKFDFWANLSTELKAILNNTSERVIAPDPIINPNSGLVTITGTPSQLKRAEAYINEMQKRLKKQVVIDVSIINVTLNSKSQRGVNWSKFQLGFGIGKNPNVTSNFPGNLSWGNRGNGLSDGFSKVLNIAANLNFNIDGLLNFLDTNGKAKVVSNPKVTTLNNQQALISVGQTVNYQVKESTNSASGDNAGATVAQNYTQYSIFVGILLNLLPEVSDDNKIMLRINPSLSNFKNPADENAPTGSTTNSVTGETTQNVRSVAPDTIQKKLSTVVHVNSGDTIILGGLIGQRNSKEHTRVPILADIPIIGGVFRSTDDNIETQELIFVITPRVVDLDEHKNVGQSLKDLGFSKTTYDRQ